MGHEPEPAAGVPSLLVSATHSGAGKTTVTRALLAALRARQLVVQPFKVGPDFIDPMYHSELAGRPSINLDVWMMGEAGIRASFARWSAGADVVVIEAMGALFDGADGGDEGSAAHVARILNIPVLVVLDVWGMTRTTAAIMDAMAHYDPAVEIGGFVLNRTGSAGHRRLIRRAVGERRWERVLATVEADPGLEVAERHLGLVTTHENPSDASNAALERLASQLDVKRILGSAELTATSPRRASPATGLRGTRPTRARLAIARDAAFCFYYEENLSALAEAGLDLVEFSPLRGETLPDGTDAVYLGGGYPESFASGLVENEGLARQLRDAAHAGMPMYGECGGLIYLGRSLRTFDGASHAMSGVLPIDVEMDPRHLSIAYAAATTRHDSLLGPAGTALRGQEFHQSRVTAAQIEPDFYDVETSDGATFVEGYQRRGVVGSYLHLHVAGGSGFAESLADAASKFSGASAAPRLASSAPRPSVTATP